MHSSLLLFVLLVLIGCGESAPTASDPKECRDDGSGEMCEPCEAGSDCVGNIPMSCGDGTWDDDGNPETPCVGWSRCAPGSSPSGGSQSTDVTCTECVSGTFSDGTGSCESWSNCLPGEFLELDGSGSTDRVCQPCAIGTFSESENSLECLELNQCPPGTYVLVAGSPSRNFQCTPCASGTYSSTTNADSCEMWQDCSAGSSATDGDATTNRTCTLCIPGTYSDQNNQDSCAACEEGEYCAAGATSPTWCEPGTYDDDGDPATPCAVCASGSYCAGGSVEPVACTAQEFDDDADPATPCALCTMGYHATEDGLSCENIDECADGSDGCAQECIDTPGSYYCSCIPGYTLRADDRECDANTYNLTLDYDDGVTPNTATTVTFDMPYGTLPIPTRTGYAFRGWWTSPGGTGTRLGSADNVAISADHSLFAEWAPLSLAGQSCTSNSQCPSGTCQRGFCKLPGFAVVPAGTFTQGSPTTEIARESNENQRLVTLTRAFFLQETEVSSADWDLLINNAVSSDTRALHYVSWWDAIAYINALSTSQGLEQCYVKSGCSGIPGTSYSCTSVTFEGPDCSGYRLPTEAEWEYAARASTTASTYIGDHQATDCSANPLLSSIAWWCGNQVTNPHEVAGRLPNAWGLYDMIGNVAEWVWDGIGFPLIGYFPDEPVTDPVRHGNPVTTRAFRGCGTLDNPSSCRAAARRYITANGRFPVLGFRPARTIVAP